MGRGEESLVYLKQAVKIREAHDRTPKLHDGQRELVSLLRAKGDCKTALPIIQQAYAIVRKDKGETAQETRIWRSHYAYCLRDSGHLEEAITLMHASLDSLLPDNPEFISNLTDTAKIFRDLGRYFDALTLLERALKTAETRNADSLEVATCNNNLGALLQDLGHYEKAMACFERSREIIARIYTESDPRIVVCLENLAEVSRRMGLFDKALALIKKASSITDKDANQSTVTANAQGRMGSIYHDMGAYAQSLELFLHAIEILNKDGELIKAAELTNNLAFLYKDMGRINESMSCYKKAAEIFTDKLGPENPETLKVLANIAYIHLLRNELSEAEILFKRAGSAHGLVEVYLASGRLDEALQQLKELQPSDSAPPSYRIEFFTQEGRMLYGMGMLTDAARSFLGAVQETEHLRQHVDVERTGFFRGGYLRSYRGLVSALAEASLKKTDVPAELRQMLQEYGNDEGAVAFYFAEAMKGRALLESIANAARSRQPIEVPQNVLMREKSITDQLQAIDAQWEDAFRRGSGIDELKKQRRKLEADFSALLVELREKYPQYTALFYPQPLRIEQLPLKDNEVLIEFSWSDEAGFIFLVRKGGVKQIIRVPIQRQRIEEKVKIFVKALGLRRPDGFPVSLAKELYDLLLKPALVDVKPTEKIIIVPDSVLSRLPFETLVSRIGDGTEEEIEYAADNYFLSYYPSASVLALERTLKFDIPGKTLFALAPVTFGLQPQSKTALSSASKNANSAFNHKQQDWPDLPGTHNEVRSIAEAFGMKLQSPDILMGNNANKAKLSKVPLQDYRYLHFATHGGRQEDAQRLALGFAEPFLVLAQNNVKQDDGYLTLSEVLNLRLSAEVVVLSACFTGQGEILEGEGLSSFARAFQRAGAKTVIVTHWDLDDVSAAEYMKLFYLNLSKGISPGEAFKLARLAIRKRYGSPYFWAVFSLYGASGS
jgi:CHAT domain-containing protein/Tfp pilus assembly protein PilF